jgi:bidirectional [NiFe] hydrogenase diaphorase subunit
VSAAKRRGPSIAVSVDVSPTGRSSHPSGDNRFKLLDRAINRNQASGSALIEVLHAAQEIFGFLEEDVLLYVAQALRRPPSQVYGVATFYNFFRLKPAGEHTVIVCTGTACYVKGASELVDELTRRCGCKVGETTRDGRVSLVSARCIGSCGLAPVAVIDGEITPRITRDRLAAKVDTWLRASRPVESEPAGEKPAAAEEART